MTQKDKVKICRLFLEIFANLLKAENSDQPLRNYSDPKFMTFWSPVQFESSWVSLYKLCTPGFGQFIPFLPDPLKLPSSWDFSSVFQLPSPGLSANALRGLSQDFSLTTEIPKPLWHCLGCLFWVIVMLTGESLTWSQACALWTRFSSRTTLYVAAFILPSSLPVPKTERACHVWYCHQHVIIGMVLTRLWAFPGVHQT